MNNTQTTATRDEQLAECLRRFTAALVERDASPVAEDEEDDIERARR